jgi:hypothetical protein
VQRLLIRERDLEGVVLEVAVYRDSRHRVQLKVGSQ